MTDREATRAAMRRQHEDDLAKQRDAYEERAAIESPENEELQWSRRFRQAATEREPVHYRETKLGIDDRLFGP